MKSFKSALTGLFLILGLFVTGVSFADTPNEVAFFEDVSYFPDAMEAETTITVESLAVFLWDTDRIVAKTAKTANFKGGEFSEMPDIVPIVSDSKTLMSKWSLALKESSDMAPDRQSQLNLELELMTNFSAKSQSPPG
jgi:hypothetical protein